MPTAHRTQVGSLNCIVVDGSPQPRIAVVVCHGYGASYEDLAPLAGEWIGYLEAKAADFRFVFPDAPNSLAELGMPQARAWWPINMAALAEAVQAANFAELHDHKPPGIDAARDMLVEVIVKVKEELGGESTPLVLGGFSQGAMLTMDTSLRGSIPPPQLLFQFSGTIVCQSQWQAALSRLADTAIFQSHGTIDPILPYTSAVALNEMLKEGGVDVDFHSFAGPHTIDVESVARTSTALATLAANAP